MRIIGLTIVFLVPFLVCAKAGTPALEPADDFLRAVKTVVDSGGVDNPATVSALLQLTFTRSNALLSTPGTCPAGSHEFDDDYSATENNWFRASPARKKITYRLQRGDLGLTNPERLGDPVINYSIAANECFGPGLGLIIGRISFLNIPSYACISEAQIDTIFPKIIPRRDIILAGSGYLQYVDDGQDIFTDDFIGINRERPFAFVNFYMTPGPEETRQPAQPKCLLGMYLSAGYNYSSLHKSNIIPLFTRMAVIPPVVALTKSEGLAISRHIAPCFEMGGGTEGLGSFNVRLLLKVDSRGTAREAKVLQQDKEKLIDPMFSTGARRVINAALNVQCANLPLPSNFSGHDSWIRFDFTQ